MKYLKLLLLLFTLTGYSQKKLNNAIDKILEDKF
jgi:hypothetical protein